MFFHLEKNIWTIKIICLFLQEQWTIGCTGKLINKKYCCTYPLCISLPSLAETDVKKIQTLVSFAVIWIVLKHFSLSSLPSNGYLHSTVFVSGLSWGNEWVSLSILASYSEILNWFEVVVNHLQKSCDLSILYLSTRSIVWVTDSRIN